jgi:hypothetical protein
MMEIYYQRFTQFTIRSVTLWLPNLHSTPRKRWNYR